MVTICKRNLFNFHCTIRLSIGRGLFPGLASFESRKYMLVRLDVISGVSRDCDDRGSIPRRLAHLFTFTTEHSGLTVMDSELRRTLLKAPNTSASAALVRLFETPYY